MSGFIDVDFNSFFDRDAVLQRVDRMERRELSKSGAFVRKSARSLIRKAKSVSQPGRPPRNRTGTLRNGILFGYDAGTQSVYIGPRLHPGASRKRKVRSGAELLEFGGVAEGPFDSGRTRYRARPFMAPALEANLDEFPQLFAEAL